MQSKKKSCGGWGVHSAHALRSVWEWRPSWLVDRSVTRATDVSREIRGKLLRGSLAAAAIIQTLFFAAALAQTPERLADIETTGAYGLCDIGTEINGIYVFSAQEVPGRTDTCRLYAASADFGGALPLSPAGVALQPIEAGGTLAFAVCDPQCSLWRTDGSPSGTVRVTAAPPLATAQAVKAVRGGLLFRGLNSNAVTSSIWFTDGTEAGTKVLAPSEAPLSQTLQQYELLNGKLYRWDADGSSVSAWRASAAGEWEEVGRLSNGAARVVRVVSSADHTFVQLEDRFGNYFVLGSDGVTVKAIAGTPVGTISTSEPFHATRSHLILRICTGGGIAPNCPYFRWSGRDAPEAYGYTSLLPFSTVNPIVLALDDALIVRGYEPGGAFYRLDASGLERLAEPISTATMVLRGNKQSTLCLSSIVGESEWLTDGTLTGTRQIQRGCRFASAGRTAGASAYWAERLTLSDRVNILRVKLDVGKLEGLVGLPSAGSSMQAAVALPTGKGVFGACTIIECALWATTGTGRDTVKLASYPLETRVIKVEASGEIAYVFLNTREDRLLLVATDGSISGTREIAEMGTSGYSSSGFGTDPRFPAMQTVAGKAYFAVCPTSPLTSCGVWETDGTSSGTRLFIPFGTGVTPDQDQLLPLVRAGAVLWTNYCRTEPLGCEGAWIDVQAKTVQPVGSRVALLPHGTRDGYMYYGECVASVGMCTLKRTARGPAEAQDARFLFPLTDREIYSLLPFRDGFLLLAAIPQPGFGLPGSPRTELWRLRENAAPTSLAQFLDFQPLISIATVGEMAFIENRGVIYRTDGTSAGTRIVPGLETVTSINGLPLMQRVGDSLVVGNVVNPRTRGLWRVTRSGSAAPLATTRPRGDALERSYPYFALRDKIVFVSDDGLTGLEPWAVTVPSADVGPGDTDSDGIPDSIELIEGTNPDVKDNDIFAATAKGVRLFVMQQYRDVFKREASEAEIAAGVAAVNAGGRAGFVATLVESQPYDDFAGPITRLYRAYFLRNPDIGGYNFWTDEYNSLRWSFSAITGFFATSPEFRTRYGNLSNEQFVWLVYNNVLERDPDPSGLAFWLKELNDHDANPATGRSASQLMADFSESPENKQKTKAKVQRVAVYAAMLKQAAPEISITLNAPTLTETINSILGSNEYRARFLP